MIKKKNKKKNINKKHNYDKDSDPSKHFLRKDPGSYHCLTKNCHVAEKQPSCRKKINISVPEQQSRAIKLA